MCAKTIKMLSLKQASAIRMLLVLLIIVAGAALRLSYNANTLIDQPIRADAAYNLVYANNLLEDRTFSKDMSANPVPDSYWAPGYPLFLAAVIKCSEILSVDTYNLILLCQVLLGVGTLIICYLLARSFLPGFWPLLPPALVAISPHLVSTGSYVLTETLFGFLLILSMYALVRAVTAESKMGWLCAGVCFGLAYLANPVSLFLAPLLAAFLACRALSKSPGHDRRKYLSRAAILVAPLIIVAGLWALRSAISVPADQPSASERLLMNLVIGLYPDYHEKWRESILQPEKNVVVPGGGIDASYGTFFNELIAKLRRDPIQMLAWYSVQKPLLLWDWDIRTGFGDIYIYRVEYSLYQSSTAAIITYSLMRSLHPWVLLGCVFGLGFLLAEHRENRVVPALLYISLVYVSLVYVVSQSEPRYSIPLRAELYLCFTYFLWRTGSWIGRVRRGSGSAARQQVGH
jgi:4-amino-4-deoxy-L-arabinose transferase-like glycosyltransferase